MPTFQTAALVSGQTFVVVRPIPALTEATAPAHPAALAPTPARTVGISTIAATAPISQVRYIDPDLAKQIVDIRPPSDGLPRDRITVPVAVSADVADDALFTDPADPQKHYYLPRYALAEERTAGGQPRYAIAVREAGPEWTLAVRLRKSAPPSLGDAVRTASEIKHSIAVLLRHNLVVADTKAAVSEESFGEVSTEGDFVNASMQLQTLAQRDAVVRALSEPGFGAQLLVRRSIDVAIPVPQPAQKVPSRPLILAAPRPAALGVAAQQRMIMLDRDCDAGIKEDQSLAPAGPRVPLFRPVNRVLDVVAPPADFTFPMALHPYIYGDITASGGAAQSLVRQAVAWSGEFRSYYQHPYDTWLFYYLPDSFKLVRRQGKTWEPLMQLRFLPAPAGAAGDPLAASRAVLDYIAYPVVDTERLADAAAKLKPLVANPLPPGVDGPQFLPLVIAPDRLKLRLRLPGAAGFVERPEASINLRSGIKDTIDLPLADFQTVFDAMFGAGLTLFTGDVAVDLGDSAGETLPFAARLEDMAGDVVDYAATLEETGVRVKLRNVIESPISISRLGATLQSGGRSVPATVSGVDFASPVKLASGATLEVMLTAAAPLPDGFDTATLDLSGITVTPDREAIYGEILDPTAPIAFSRTIHVVTAEERFKVGEAPAARIVVEFEGGDAVDLHPGHVEGDAEVQRPIADFILRRSSTGSYRYRLQTLPATGGVPTVGEWRDGSSDIVLV